MTRNRLHLPPHLPLKETRGTEHGDALPTAPVDLDDPNAEQDDLETTCDPGSAKKPTPNLPIVCQRVPNVRNLLGAPQRPVGPSAAFIHDRSLAYQALNLPCDPLTPLRADNNSVIQLDQSGGSPYLRAAQV